MKQRWRSTSRALPSAARSTPSTTDAIPSWQVKTKKSGKKSGEKKQGENMRKKYIKNEENAQVFRMCLNRLNMHKQLRFFWFCFPRSAWRGGARRLQPVLRSALC
jgi:hypothetical protein